MDHLDFAPDADGYSYSDNTPIAGARLGGSWSRISRVDRNQARPLACRWTLSSDDAGRLIDFLIDHQAVKFSANLILDSWRTTACVCKLLKYNLSEMSGDMIRVDAELSVVPYA